MNWKRVIDHLQSETEKIYIEIGSGKYDLGTAASMMGAAEVCRILAEALLSGDE